MAENTNDTLCVIHQSTDFELVKSSTLFQVASRIWILTSHKLFPFEISSLEAQLADAGKTLAGAACFGDFLDDKSLVACDDQASAALLPHVGSADYIAKYQAKMTTLKNQALLEAIGHHWQFENIIVSEGLGISSSAWLAAEKNTSVIPAVTESNSFAKVRQFAQSLWRRIYKPFKRYDLLRIQGETPVFFWSSISRLNFQPGINFRTIRGNIQELQSILTSSEGGVLATTIHEYDPAGLQQQLRAPFEIYVDGLHPANMPRCYLDGYPDACYVVRDMFDDQWFRQFGKTTRPGREFLTSSKMELPGSSRPVNRIYLMLNHAGDWMALINRSDTDLLLLAFVELAKLFPEVQFVVRPHPGTAHPDHEGTCAINRIKKLIKVTRLGNLEVSGGTLEQDLAAADLIISEYSNVLVEGWRQGIPGLIVNLTRRRNFMQDYSALGFPTVTSEEQLHSWFARILARPQDLIDIHTSAATGYNQRLAIFLESL